MAPVSRLTGMVIVLRGSQTHDLGVTETLSYYLSSGVHTDRHISIDSVWTETRAFNPSQNNSRFDTQMISTVALFPFILSDIL